jgi:hypothetical protein
MRWLALSLGVGVILGGAGGWWAMRRQVTVEARRLAQLMVEGAVARPPVPPAPAGVGRSADGAGGEQVPVIAISEDLAVAARALLAIRDPAVRQSALVRFLELLPQARWPEFLRSFEQLGHRGEFDDEPGSFMSALGTMEVVFAKMTARDPAGFLQQLLDEKEESGNPMASVTTALRFWAAKDLTGAVAFFDQNLRSLPPAEQVEAARGLAREWVRRDAAAAFAWIKNLPEENRTSVAHGAFQTLSHVDSAAALRFLVTETALPGRSDFAYDMARGWAATEPEKAVGWAKTVPDDLAAMALKGAMEPLAAKDFAVAVREYDGIKPEQRDVVLGVLGANMGEAPQPERVAEVIRLVEEAAEGEGRAAAAHFAMLRWTRQDPEAASAWVAGQPEGGTRDAAIQGFAYASVLAKTDPEAGLEWAATVSNQEQRLSALGQNVKAWVEYDPAAAREWVQSTPRLNDDDRGRLLLLTRK